MPQYSKYYQACQKKGTNAKQLKFQPQDNEQVKEVNDGYLCLGSLDRLEDNRSNAVVKCPLDGSVHAKAKFDNQVCQTCQLCLLGKDALGLNITIEQDEQPKSAAKTEIKTVDYDLTMPSYL